MKECANLKNCSFVKEFEKDEKFKKALNGYINNYCKGSLQDVCVRKKVSKTLGDPKSVPVNMKPNGLPVMGTSDKDWPEEVKKIVS